MKDVGIDTLPSIQVNLCTGGGRERGGRNREGEREGGREGGERVFLREVVLDNKGWIEITKTNV